MIRPLIESEEPAPSIMVVLSLSMTTDFAEPSLARVKSSSFIPISSETTSPPVRMEISSSIAFLRSPNPGALTEAHFRVPRILLTTRVARASPSTSSAISKNGLPVLAICSRTGRRSFMLLTFFSTRRMNIDYSNIQIHKCFYCFINRHRNIMKFQI